MGKISPVSIKYIIYAKFEAEGTVEKPDVIGALFGQTEGLLGEDLEMRELQKEGKIGRIDVALETENSKTRGKIELPSALDKAETTIIAAALETIERIGPSDSKIEIERIEDVRGSKRDYIVERAKKLLEKIEGSSESGEMENAVKISSRVSRLQEYGPENLPAGDISGNDIIVVEGRADVIALLKAKVTNVIAMNGTILPETIKELSFEKEVTLFLDGDRGGKLIAKNAINNSRIDFIIFAPDGKEVEELSPKEILSSLRKKIKAEEFSEREDGRSYRRTETRRTRTEPRTIEEPRRTGKVEKLKDEEVEKLRDYAEEIAGTRAAILLDENLEIVRKVPLSQLYNLRLRKAFTMVIDGNVTANVVKTAEKLDCEHLAAKNFSFTDTNIDLVSL